MVQVDFEPHLLPDYLPTYYKRLFPFDQYYKWLSYGNVPKTYFPHREFSFTLADDIYIRYQSFRDQEDMEKEIQKRCPHKIDIGAVFSYRPKEHRSVAVFSAKQKELVFDIDMTDYDEVRNCCQGAQICPKCWKYMVVAVKILDVALREDFGFQHLLWVFSGRRGVHCWVCDAGARSLSQSARTAVAEYLQVVRGGASQSKKVTITSSSLHPHLRRSMTIIEEYFGAICLEEQDVLGTEEKWARLVGLLPDPDLRRALQQSMRRCTDSEQRWQMLRAECESAAKKKKKSPLRHAVAELMLQLVYPRLDINVSKGLNHLLKSPFSIHPKTGRVCVPFDPATVDSFDPFQAPTISQLMEEINAYDATASDDGRLSDYKKTSMRASVAVFEAFLAALAKENAARRLDESDKKLQY